MYFAVLSGVNNCQVEDILNNIQTKLFGPQGGFKSLFSTHIVLEKVQLKRVYPPERIGPRRSLATREHGALPASEGRPSSRSYLFNLSSSLITGASDDFSIRVPYVAHNMGALGLINNSKLIQNQDPTESIINLLSPPRGRYKLKYHRKANRHHRV